MNCLQMRFCLCVRVLLSTRVMEGVVGIVSREQHWPATSIPQEEGNAKQVWKNEPTPE